MKILKIVAMGMILSVIARSLADEVENAEKRLRQLQTRYRATIASASEQAHKQIRELEIFEHRRKAPDLGKLEALKGDGLLITSWNKLPAWMEARNRLRVNKSREQLLIALRTLRVTYVNSAKHDKARAMDIEILAHESESTRPLPWPPEFLREERYYYLQHKVSGKYIGTHYRVNGAPFSLGGPVPAGQHALYRFKLVPSAEQHYFHLIHEHSGRYMCADNRNGNRIHLWSPIPDGHEDRYKFKIVYPVGGYHCLYHKYSGKYLGTSSKMNGDEVQVWNADSLEHKAAFQFRLISSPQDPNPPERG